ncbi:MAG: hypothetical protein ACI3Y5_03880 [Prevotella sp.]
MITLFIPTAIAAVADTLLGVSHHGLHAGRYRWRRTRNAWAIDMAMAGGGVGHVANKWTYGLVNSLVGNLVAHLWNLFGRIDRVSAYGGVIALSGATPANSAMTIGHYALGPAGYTADWRDHLFVHEYGHYLQSLVMGPLFFPVVALPSLLSAWFTSRLCGMRHEERWFEADASRRGARHFLLGARHGTAGGDGGQEPRLELRAFRRGGVTPYLNPRLGLRRQDKMFPTKACGVVVWDFVL